MNAYKTIKKELEEIAEGSPFSIDQPEDFSHGDYATNIAFSLSKLLKIAPSKSIFKF